jgi:RNA polymerase sigma factor (sigma-70 family)
MTDVELLNQHRQGSDAAFADLVRRHLGWVYGVARRRLRDAHLAEDVSQAVFVLLHRKAPEFAADSAMITWLHKTAWYASETAARTERRRRARETEAAIMQPSTIDSSDPADWQQLAPILDQLIGKLSRSDREAILLRYYRDLPFAEVAAQIGTTPDAARKRVDRAIEKLRRLAADQGAALSVASLSAHLLNYARISPPPGLVATATVTATAPAGSVMAASCANIVKGATLMMSSTKLTLAAAAAILLITSVVLSATWFLGPSASVPPAPIAAAPSIPQQPVVKQVAKDAPKRLAPFSGIRWRKDVPEVQVDGVWYELMALNDLPVAQIFAYQKGNRDKNSWKKHFSEDLVDVLTRMGHEPSDTMNLQVRTLDANKNVSTLKDVPNTGDNRQRLMVWPAPDQKSLFAAVRWHSAVPQVQVNGTWYDLVSIDQEPDAKIIDFAKTTYGQDWQKQFEENLMDILTRMGQRPNYVANLELHTLDSDELVTLTIRVPMTAPN